MRLVRDGRFRTAGDARFLLALRYARLLLLVGLAGSAHAQTFLIQPPQVVTGGVPRTRLLFKSTDTVLLSWTRSLTNATLRIGTTPGIYTFRSVPVSGTSAPLSLSSLGLAAGTYYAIITESSANTLAGIQAAFQSNPDLDYSPEVPFVVEAPTTPGVVAPRGAISEATPRFSWEAVPGVPAYLVVVSSTPFEVQRDPVTDEVTVEGANVVWQLLTTSTSAVYGEVNPDSPLPVVGVPPLQPGNAYNFTVLNAYSETDLAYISDVFGSVVAFTYEAGQVLAPPVLTAPAAGSTLYGAASLAFDWEPVEGASQYTVYLRQRVQEGSTTIDLPLWNTTTGSTVVDFPARTWLRRGTYTWYVVPEGSAGTGTASATRTFQYEVDMGRFTARSYAVQDGAGVVGTSVTVTPLDGGYTPSAPFVASQGSTYSDSLVAGTYRFTATHANYADTSRTVTITADQTTVVDLYLRSLASRVNGQVVDQTGAAVREATITFTRTSTGAKVTATTTADGSFSVAVDAGTWTVQASKSGYLPSTATSLTVGVSAQVGLPTALTLTNDAVTVSGTVQNQDGFPVALATVTATRSGTAQQATTNSAGQYTLALSSGSWALTVSKAGFVSPSPTILPLVAGAHVQNQQLVLTDRANHIKGTVQALVAQPDGTTTLAALSGATVTFTPAAGVPLRLTSTTGGAFTADLAGGAWHVRAQAPGYAPSEAVTVDFGEAVGKTMDGVVFTLIPAQAAVSGLARLPDGTPLEGVSVRVAGGAEAVTASNGAFALYLPPGLQVLAASKSGYEALAPHTVVLDGQGTLAGIHFDLVPNAGAITGSLISNGIGLAGATVTATGSPGQVTATTGDDGAFRLDLAPGPWTLTSHPPGFQPAPATSLTVVAGQERLASMALAPEAARITGVVTDAHGAVRSARLEFTDLTTQAVTQTLTWADGGFGLPAVPGRSYQVVVSRTGYKPTVRTFTASSGLTNLDVSLAPGATTVSGQVTGGGTPLRAATVTAWQGAMAVSTTATDAEGRYSLSLDPGSYELAFTVPGYADRRLALALGAGQQVSDFDQTLEEAFASVQGQVLDDQGRGLPEVLVTLRGTAGGASTRTGADGTFLLPRLAEGAYTALVQPPGYAPVEATVTLAARAAVRQTFTLSPQPGVVEGRTTDLSGQPVAGTTLVALHADGRRFATVSGADGHYTLAGLPVGSFTVTAARTGYFSTETVSITLTDVALTAVADVTDLHAGSARIQGTVRDAESGMPRWDLAVTADGPTGRLQARTNTQGAYVLEGLQPGSYTLIPLSSSHAGSSQVVTVGEQQTVTLDLTTRPNQGRISGRVTDPDGQALPFTVAVHATTGTLRYSTTTDAVGNFLFEGLAAGRPYTLTTDLFRQGYANASTDVMVPEGSGPQDIPFATLHVPVLTASLTGNAGTSGAVLQVTDTATGAVVQLGESLSDGRFTIGALAAGTYRLTPSKPGFTFNPASATLTVQTGQQQAFTFTATVQGGALTITTTRPPGEALAAVSVSVVSSDNRVVVRQTTGTDGRTTFSNLPGGQRYTVKAVREGFGTAPGALEVDLGIGQTQAVSFVLTPGTASFTGLVTTGQGVPLGEATVSAQRPSEGDRYTTTTGADGRFTLAGLPAGAYDLYISRDGFAPQSQAQSLATDEQKDGLAFSLPITSAHLTGRVRVTGASKEGLAVVATGLVQRTMPVQPDGTFAFAYLPVSTGPGETTLYELTLRLNGAVRQTQTVSFNSTQVGQTVATPELVLPSGELRLTFTDGLQPLSGVAVTLTGPDGGSQAGLSDSDGTFRSGQTLRRGLHRVAVERDGYARPTASTLQFDLPSDTALVVQVVDLPWQHKPLSSIAAGADTPLAIGFRNGFEPGNATATLFYRQASRPVFTPIPLTRQDTTFAGVLPALYALEAVSYYLQVDDPARQATWQTSTYTLTPTAAGILTTARLNPGIGGGRLRQDEAYTLQLDLRDGLGEALHTAVTGDGGQVNWRASDPSVVLTWPVPGDSTSVTVRTSQPGTFTLTATATLAGAVATATASFLVTDVAVETVTPTAPVARLDNRSTGIQLGTSVVGADGAALLLGESLTWSVWPAAAGQVSATGVFIPDDPGFIGPVTITAHDAVSGASGQVTFPLFARVDGQAAVTLHDGAGFRLVLPQGALPFPGEVSLSPIRTATPKQHARPVGTQQAYTASDRLYRVTLAADRALPGDSLQSAAHLELPSAAVLRFFEGTRVVGRYDPYDVQWHVLASNTSGEALATEAFWQFGEYGVLAAQEALGLTRVAVLPSPFSPDIAPVKIGYVLTTPASEALVSIRIFNMRGERVRTLLERDLQYPGRYGSASSNREIVWDGRTDEGTVARNGRYVVQITARDTEGEVSELVPVVLVK